MTLLVLHDLEPGTPAAHALTAAVFEIAPGHWAPFPGAVLVAADVSPRYLRDHLVRSLHHRGHAAPKLLVAPLGTGAVSAGLPPEGPAWLRELEEAG